MLIGDGKKFLTCFMTLKTELNSNNLLEACSSYYKDIGCTAKTSI